MPSLTGRLRLPLRGGAALPYRDWQLPGQSQFPPGKPQARAQRRAKRPVREAFHADRPVSERSERPRREAATN